MSIIYFLYNEIFYRPLLNSLVFLINVSPFYDAGIAIVLLTILVKLILFPLTHRSIKTQIKMRSIEPELRKIKTDNKNRQKQAQEILNLYKQHGISPYSGFLMILLQLPILIALYQVFWKGMTFDKNLYSFINMPQDINLIFLGIFDITKKSWILAFFTALLQFFQIKLSLPPKQSLPQEIKNFQDALTHSMTSQMKYVMPVFIFFIVLNFPAAIPLYWTTMNIFAIVHEWSVRKGIKN